MAAPAVNATELVTPAATAAVVAELREYYDGKYPGLFTDENYTLATEKALVDDTITVENFRQQLKTYLHNLKELKRGPLSDPSLGLRYPPDSTLLEWLYESGNDLGATEQRLAEDLFKNSDGKFKAHYFNKTRAMSIVSAIATSIFRLMIYSSPVMQTTEVNNAKTVVVKDRRVWERMRENFYSVHSRGPPNYWHYTKLNQDPILGDAAMQGTVRHGIWQLCKCTSPQCQQKWDQIGEYHRSQQALLGMGGTIGTWDVTRFYGAFVFWRTRVGQGHQACWKGFCEERWIDEVEDPNGHHPWANMPRDSEFGHEFFTELISRINSISDLHLYLKPRVIAELLVKTRNFVIHFGPVMSDADCRNVIDVFKFIFKSPFLEKDLNGRLRALYEEILETFTELEKETVDPGTSISPEKAKEIYSLLNSAGRLSSDVRSQWQHLYTVNPLAVAPAHQQGLGISVFREAHEQAPMFNAFRGEPVVLPNIPRNSRVHVGNARLHVGETQDPVARRIIPSGTQFIDGAAISNWPLLLDDRDMAPNDANLNDYPFILFFDRATQKWFVQRSPGTNRAEFRYQPNVLANPGDVYTVGQRMTGVFVETPNDDGTYGPKELLGVDADEPLPADAAGIPTPPPAGLAAAEEDADVVEGQAEMAGEGDEIADEVSPRLGGPLGPGRITLVHRNGWGTRITVGKHVIVVTRIN